MNGLILSKDATAYLQMAQAQQADFVAHALTNVEQVLQLPSEQRSRIEWLLTEPALGVSVLDALPNLRWVQSTWAGVEKILAHPRRDYALTNIRGVFAPLISEYVLAHCLAHERQLYAHHAAQAQGLWFNDATGAQVGRLAGKTALILGVGSIGEGLARTLRTLGVRVIGVVKSLRDCPACDGVGTMADLPELLPQADYVVNTLPNTADTQSFIDADFLRQMPSSALLINVGRGQAVVEADLSSALHAGIIAGAVLDVYREEPLPSNHVFWNTPRLHLTSHTAAPSFPSDIFQVFWNNHQRHVAGLALQHVVDFDKGY